MLTLLTFCGLISTKCFAQPQQNAQWSFYLAFEDATGAKDSLWFLLDTAATYPWSISDLYGEVPFEPDSVNFQVWFYHPLDFVNGNPTERYNTFLNNIDDDEAALGPELFGTNFELPIILRWDSTLFTADILYEYGGNPINEATLDNDYLFLSGGGETGWDMTQTDHVELPYFWWGSSNQFPLYLVLRRGRLSNELGVNELQQKDFSLFPNPATDYAILKFTRPIAAKLNILDVNGKLVKSSSFSGDRTQINIDDLESGLYFIEIQSEVGRMVKKLVIGK